MTIDLLSFGVLFAGLLSFGDLLGGFREVKSESEPGVFSWRGVRGVTGDFFFGTSEVPALLTVNICQLVHKNACNMKINKAYQNSIERLSSA